MEGQRSVQFPHDHDSTSLAPFAAKSFPLLTLSVQIKKPDDNVNDGGRIITASHLF
jgi:hypothetical protein